jgi:hypothetical protein
MTKGMSDANIRNGRLDSHKKAPDHAGAFEPLKFSRDQYLATTGPVQLKR